MLCLPWGSQEASEVAMQPHILQELYSAVASQVLLGTQAAGRAAVGKRAIPVAQNWEENLQRLES